MSCKPRQSRKKRASVVTVITKKEITRRLASTDQSTSGSSCDFSSSSCDCSDCCGDSRETSSDATSASTSSLSSSSSSCSCCGSSSSESAESSGSDDEQVCYRASCKTSSKPLVGRTAKAAPKTVRGSGKSLTTGKCPPDGKKKNKTSKSRSLRASAKPKKPLPKSKVVSTPVKKTSKARSSPRKANVGSVGKQANSYPTKEMKNKSASKTSGKPSAKQASQKKTSSRSTARTQKNSKQTAATTGDVKPAVKPKINKSKSCKPLICVKKEMTDECPGRSA
ncbi:hypothetical protein RRG08_063499 [Elysia crispata]|uniref:Uncharacterized protein n=1 Tax=Elysia crispata TaxID=231223 RepID=A0AAE1B557_9GAST|nr:hypothetical protein RRG08_063499 [Elysia crispata]